MPLVKPMQCILSMTEYPTCPESSVGIGGRVAPCSGPLMPTGSTEFAQPTYAMSAHGLLSSYALWRCYVCNGLIIGSALAWNTIRPPGHSFEQIVRQPDHGE
jgi:hypothetical protein